MYNKQDTILRFIKTFEVSGDIADPLRHDGVIGYVRFCQR